MRDRIILVLAIMGVSLVFALSVGASKFALGLDSEKELAESSTNAADMYTHMSELKNRMLERGMDGGYSSLFFKEGVYSMSVVYGQVSAVVDQLEEMKEMKTLGLDDEQRLSSARDEIRSIKLRTSEFYLANQGLPLVIISLIIWGLFCLLIIA